MNVPVNIAKNVGSFASKHPTKYSMEGVLLTRDKSGEPMAVANDGRSMIITSWHSTPADDKTIVSQETYEPPIIPAGILKERAVGGNDVIVDELSKGSDVVQITSGSKKNTQKHKKLEAKYPNFDGAVPDYSPLKLDLVAGQKTNHAAVALIDAKRLRNALNVLIDIHDSDGEDTVLETTLQVPTDSGFPLVIETSGKDNSQKSKVILMPVEQGES